MAVTLKPHEHAPVIQERCQVCRRFGEHQNGSVKMARPLDVTNLWETSAALVESEMRTMDVTATQCLYCSWVQLYR